MCVEFQRHQIWWVNLDGMRRELGSSVTEPSLSLSHGFDFECNQTANQMSRFQGHAVKSPRLISKPFSLSL